MINVRQASPISSILIRIYRREAKTYFIMLYFVVIHQLGCTYVNLTFDLSSLREIVTRNIYMKLIYSVKADMNDKVPKQIFRSKLGCIRFQVIVIVDLNYKFHPFYYIRVNTKINFFCSNLGVQQTSSKLGKNEAKMQKK